jgi:hypothetical protein
MIAPPRNGLLIAVLVSSRADLLDVPAMKPRHAAALALVGWYLMLPPVTGVIDPDSPRHHFPGWKMIEEFKSEDDCNVAQSKLLAQAIRHSLDYPVDQAARDENEKKFKARCVSEDTMHRWKTLEGTVIPVD